MYEPTKEKIDEVREKKWWDSKEKPLLAFFRSIYASYDNELTLYVPEWLGKNEFSKTYNRHKFDGPYVNESTLSQIGVTLKRETSYNAVPAEDLKALGYNKLENFSYFHPAYYRAKLKYSCEKVNDDVKSLIMSIGVVMPTTAEWKKNTEK